MRKVDTTALYAALDDETQEASLRWAEGQPNSDVTVQCLGTFRLSTAHPKPTADAVRAHSRLGQALGSGQPSF